MHSIIYLWFAQLTWHFFWSCVKRETHYFFSSPVHNVDYNGAFLGCWKWSAGFESETFVEKQKWSAGHETENLRLLPSLARTIITKSIIAKSIFVRSIIARIEMPDPALLTPQIMTATKWTFWHRSLWPRWSWRCSCRLWSSWFEV